jgi:hypothetical protein
MEIFAGTDGVQAAQNIESSINNLIFNFSFSEHYLSK